MKYSQSSHDISRSRQVYRYEIRHPAYKGGDYRILHLSDIHFNDRNTKYYFEGYRKYLSSMEYDLAVITGDIVDFDARHMDDSAIRLLRAVRSPHRFWIMGNHDYFRQGNLPILRERMNEAGFRFLFNESAELRENLRVIGIDEWNKGTPDYEAAFRDAGDSFNIVLLHSFDRNISQYPGHLWLSGHNHAGEIWKLGILFLKRKMTYRDPYRQVAGIYPLSRDKISIVNPGMYTHISRYGMQRIFSQKEGLVEITLKGR